MIASARMYSITPAVGAQWRRLLEIIADRAGQTVDVLDWPAPMPIAELWDKPDKAAVFMCGLPFSLATPQPEVVAAPVPALPRSSGQPVYWSDLVVRADSPFHELSETFGHRIAFTMPDSQSGYAAMLHLLMESATDEPLYREIVAPCINPYGALAAVTDGLADVAPIDSWSFALMRRHTPEQTAQVRIIARTEPTPIPLLIASEGRGQLLAGAFLAAHDDSELRPIMQQLLVERFVQPRAEAYDTLKHRWESAKRFWRRQPLAEVTDPAFALEPGDRST